MGVCNEPSQKTPQKATNNSPVLEIKEVENISEMQQQPKQRTLTKIPEQKPELMPIIGTPPKRLKNESWEDCD